MKKILILFGLTLATVTLSAQERLDFSQPDPVSATPVRSNKLFRFALGARMDFSPVIAASGGFEISPSLLLGFELRPWRNRHYFGLGVATEYVNSSLEKAHYAITGDILTFDKAENGSMEMDRFGYAFPLTYGFDFNQRQSLEFSVIPHYWTDLKLTNLYGGGPQFEYVQEQGLGQMSSASTIGTYYKGYSPFTVDFAIAYYPIANGGIGLKFSPPMLFKKGKGPDYTTVSWSFIFRF
jgi:hypothetical protein